MMDSTSKNDPQLAHLLAEIMTAMRELNKKFDSLVEQMSDQKKVQELFQAELEVLKTNMAKVHAKGTSGVAPKSPVAPQSISSPPQEREIVKAPVDPKPVPSATQGTPSNTWVTVAKSKAKAKPSIKKLAATGRAFAPPTVASTVGRYDYVYLHQSRRLDRKEIRSRFTSLGIDTSRILDLSFPARSVVGILLHAEYKPEFLAKLSACKIVPIANFDPLSHEHVIDPKFKDVPVTQR